MLTGMAAQQPEYPTEPPAQLRARRRAWQRRQRDARITAIVFLTVCFTALLSGVAIFVISTH
jgi:hypothetical protein